MKKHYNIITFILLLSSSVLLSQVNQESIDKFVKKTNAEVTVNNNSGIVKFIKFSIEDQLSINGNTLKEKSINFLEENKSIYSLESVKNSLVYESEKTDSHGLKECQRSSNIIKECLFLMAN